MSLFKDIQLALDGMLNGLNSGLPIAWENSKYTPKPGTAWMRPTVLNSSSETQTLDSNQDNPGIYQIDIFYPMNKGTAELLDKIDEVYEYFASNRVISFGNNTVNIRNISKRPSAVDDIWFAASVEINFNCYS